MAVTNEQVAAYLASNPNLSDAEIAQVAAAAGVSAQQLSEVTGVPVAQIQSRVAAAAPSIQLPSTAPQAPTKTWDEAYSEYGNALRSGDVTASTIKDLYGGLSSDFSSNIIKIKSEIDAQKQAGTADYWGAGNLASPDSAAWDAAFRLAEKGVGSLYDLKQVDGQTVNAKTGQPLEGFGNAYNYDLDYNLQFSPEGIPVLTASNQQSDWVSKWRPAAQVLGQIALGATGVGGMLGSSLGLTGTAANVAGGALLGGGTSALTGGNVLKGALLGGGGAYVSSLLNSGVTDPDLLQAAYDADVAGGMIPEFGTNAAYDSFMQAAMTPEAQAAIEQMINQPYIDADVAGGMVPEYGTNEAYDAFMQSAMTPEAKAAIEQTIANSSVAGMTPEQILQQGDMITDIASGNAMGPVTAEDLGKAFEEYMAQGGYTSTPETGALGSTVTAAPETTPTVGTPAEVTTGSVASTLGGLTASQIADLLKAGVSLAALSGAANAVGGGGGGGGAAMQTPTQGVPTNSPNYYNQLQQYYNAYLPQTPRDVVAPLQQWYEGSFGSTGTNTAISPQQAQTAMPPTPSGTVMPTAPVRPTTPTPVAPTAPTSVPKAASTGLFNTPMTAQQQVQNLLSSPNLSSLPPEAAAAISRAVSAPRSYNDVVASGGQNTVDVSSLSPEVQRAYDLYQQSMILGANSSEVRKAYERAGVNPTNPDAFFAGQGLLTGTPTQAALAQYAPLALDRFAKSGGGALTFTVDPSTVPSAYTAPNIPDISFNMDRYVQSINNNTKISDAAKQRLISEQAVKRGFNPSEFI